MYFNILVMGSKLTKKINNYYFSPFFILCYSFVKVYTYILTSDNHNFKQCRYVEIKAHEKSQYSVSYAQTLIQGHDAS